jgi:GNAT superfamily N-acetyltransferase
MDAHGPWRVASLSPSRRDDFVEFFDHERGRAFADNPAWAGCYCHYYHAAPALDWETLEASANRTAIASRIEVGEMEGFVADDASGRIVGWLNAQPRHKLPHAFARLDLSPTPLDVPAHEAALVLCFIVDPKQRRHGVARALLDYALATFADRGIRVVDAFPTASRTGEPTEHCRGPLALFQRAGFEEIARHRAVAVVRKHLG